MMGSNRHGFCEEKVCLAILVEFFEHVNKIVDRGEPVDKALHKRLLKKLWDERQSHHGVKGKVFSLIKNWLRDKEQRVRLKCNFHHGKKLTVGGPQDSDHVLCHWVFFKWRGQGERSVVRLKNLQMAQSYLC